LIAAPPRRTANVHGYWFPSALPGIDEEGTTLAEIAKATDWQNHSIRGFVSGHVSKKLGLKVESTKSETGERTYRIVG
jgi:hypothetical protein